MESYFNESAWNDLQSRLKQLTPEHQAQWGKMNVAQMMKHCQHPLQTALGKEEVVMKPNWLIKFFFKRMMYSSKPFQKNAPTPPVFQVADERDFIKEKEQLKHWMTQLWNDRDNELRRPHPVFGNFTKEQWGILQWKHLDHHFRQFGV